MLIPMLASFAMISSTPEPLVVIDERPTFRILLAKYDLSRPEDVRKLKRKIGWAADRVCVRGYGPSFYLESVECVKSTVADANAQLAKLLGKPNTADMVGAMVVVSAPSN